MFAASVNRLLAFVPHGSSLELPLLHLILPVGISFYTFQSMSYAIDLYRGLAKNKKSIKFIALHFIVTPEFLKQVSKYSDCLEIFSLRLDRGLSPKSILKTIPGERWNSEKGLNDLDYIVPGAGGIGELLNNSFV
jgi:uracil phosphoribosyltransferase